MKKLQTLKTFIPIVQALQRQGRKVVFTNGCFDLLHVGHVRYLEAARALGDCLIVAVNSDASVRRLKGPTRPILSQRHRMEVLSALSSVDYLILFGADTPRRLIAALKPDILVKGADWQEDAIVGKEIVEANGGRVARIRQVPGASTSQIVQRILQCHAAKGRKPGKRSPPSSPTTRR